MSDYGLYSRSARTWTNDPWECPTCGGITFSALQPPMCLGYGDRRHGAVEMDRTDGEPEPTPGLVTE